MNMKEDYPWIVVPHDVRRAKALGLSSTFCRTRRSAEEECYRLNAYSGTDWFIRETNDDDKLNWNI